MATSVGVTKIGMTHFDWPTPKNPQFGAKIWDLSLMQAELWWILCENFQIFVTLGTVVVWHKFHLHSLIGRSRKTPIWCKNLGDICYTSRVMTCVGPAIRLLRWPVLRRRDLRLLAVVRTLRQKFPNTLCRRFLHVSVSDAVLLWRTIDWTVEHRRIFVILCISVYIFVCVNCCVPVVFCSRCYAEYLCLYSRLTDYRSLFLDLFNELLFDRLD